MAISKYYATGTNLLGWKELNDALPLPTVLTPKVEAKQGFTSAYGEVEKIKPLTMIKELGAVKFYLNLITPLTSVPANIGCDLVDMQNQTVTANFCTVQALNIDGVNFHLYCEDADFSAETVGCRRLLIYDADTNTSLFLSDEFQVIAEANVLDYAVATFRNVFDFNSIYYTLLPTFYQQFHLSNVREFTNDLEADISVYDKVSDYSPQKTLARVQPYLELRFYDYDKYKHLAIRSMFMHSDLTMNATALEGKDVDYKTNQTDSRGHFLYNADVKVYLKDNSFNAKLC